MRKYLLFIVLILLTNCAKQITSIEENPIGKHYTGTITLLNKELPLPEGDWKVIGRGLLDSGNYVELILIKEVDNKPHSLIKIKRDTRQNSYNGYIARKTFKRDNMLHNVVKNNSTGEAQDAWCINHFRYSYRNDKASPANKEVFKYLVDNNYVMPDNFVYTQHHFTGAHLKSKYLEYRIYSNPEMLGFAPSANSEWASSDWNIMKINKYPKKAEYIEKLKNEGTIFHQKLKVAFGK